MKVWGEGEVGFGAEKGILGWAKWGLGGDR